MIKWVRGGADRGKGKTWLKQDYFTSNADNTVEHHTSVILMKAARNPNPLETILHVFSAMFYQKDCHRKKQGFNISQQ